VEVIGADPDDEEDLSGDSIFSKGKKDSISLLALISHLTDLPPLGVAMSNRGGVTPAGGGRASKAISVGMPLSQGAMEPEKVRRSAGISLFPFLRLAAGCVSRFIKSPMSNLDRPRL